MVADREWRGGLYGLFVSARAQIFSLLDLFSPERNERNNFFGDIGAEFSGYCIEVKAADASRVMLGWLLVPSLRSVFFFFPTCVCFLHVNVHFSFFFYLIFLFPSLFLFSGWKNIKKLSLIDRATPTA